MVKVATNKIENDLEKTLNNNDLVRLFNLEKMLIRFSAALKLNNVILNKFSRVISMEFTEEERDLLDDITIDNVQAIETADIYSKILNEMMSFFSSVISNNLNKVMKSLTMITIIIAIPTLIAGVFGMNVSLPFQQSPFAFIITIAISILATIIGVVIFIYRKWF